MILYFCFYYANYIFKIRKVYFRKLWQYFTHKNYIDELYIFCKGLMIIFIFIEFYQHIILESHINKIKF